MLAVDGFRRSEDWAKYDELLEGWEIYFKRTGLTYAKSFKVWVNPQDIVLETEDNQAVASEELESEASSESSELGNDEAEDVVDGDTTVD